MSLIAELRRRNIFRVAAAYVVVGWLILQVGEVLAPALHRDKSVWGENAELFSRTGEARMDNSRFLLHEQGLKQGQDLVGYVQDCLQRLHVERHFLDSGGDGGNGR